MPCLFSYVLSQRCSRPSESVLSAGIAVFLSACVCSETLPLLSWALSVSLLSIQSLTYPHSLFSFTYYFPSVCLLVSSSSFLLSLSSHRGCMHSCQEGRRCLWSVLDKDQASPPRYPPSCSPSPPPWENGCNLLSGRAPAPLWVCCQPWQQRLNMICLSAAACLHQTLAPSPITPARDSEGWLVGTHLEWGSSKWGDEGLKGWWRERVREGGDVGRD